MWLWLCPTVWSLTMIKTLISNYFWFSKIFSRVCSGPWLSELKGLYDNCQSLFSIRITLHSKPAWQHRMTGKPSKRESQATKQLTIIYSWYCNKTFSIPVTVRIWMLYVIFKYFEWTTPKISQFMMWYFKINIFGFVALKVSLSLSHEWFPK